MIKKIISFAVRQPLVMLALAAFFIGYGWYAFKMLPVEAFPDVDDPQVQIFVQWPGQSAEDVESQITLQLEMALNVTPQLRLMRSESIFGLSIVTMTFQDNVDLNVARANVLNAMTQATLPAGSTWQMSSLTTSAGEIFRYVIKDPYHKIEDIRAVQDWVLEPAFRQVAGVGDFETYGGAIKQYQVLVKPELLSEHGVTLEQVFQALQNNNTNIGGNILRSGEQALVVRGVGFLRTIDDIRNVAITNYNAHPVYVKDVAQVTTGPAPRQGLTSYWHRRPDGSFDRTDDIVEACILNLQGTDALKVIDGVKEQMNHLNRDVLPGVLPGAQLVETYERTDLVEATLHTVMHNLLLGAILILGVSLLFTSNIRAALIIWLVIPLSLLAAFMAIYLRGIPANLLSFGAVDFGILVDAAVVIVEAVLVSAMTLPQDGDFAEMVTDTSSGLARSLLFSQLILVVALIPIFTFQHIEGRIFRPMALTFAGAIIGATIVTFTLVPLAAAVLFKRGRKTSENVIFRRLKESYGNIIALLLDHKLIPLGLVAVMIGIAILMAAHLGTEFLPNLDEGNIWLDVDMPLSISPDTAKQTELRIGDILASFPESRQIVAQLGRPEDGYDDGGWNHIEIGDFFIPKSQWTTREPVPGTAARQRPADDHYPAVDSGDHRAPILGV